MFSAVFPLDSVEAGKSLKRTADEFVRLEEKFMKYKITFSIALILSIVLISLTNSDSTAQAKIARIYNYDTGIITLGPNQKIVVTVSNVTLNGDVVFLKTDYDSMCNGSVCKYSVVSESQSNPVNLAIGEGASDTVAYSSAVAGTRITAMSRNPNLRVNGQIVDTISGAVVSTFSWGVGCANC
jgi:hypothetical protein